MTNAEKLTKTTYYNVNPINAKKMFEPERAKEILLKQKEKLMLINEAETLLAWVAKENVPVTNRIYSQIDKGEINVYSDNILVSVSQEAHKDMIKSIDVTTNEPDNVESLQREAFEALKVAERNTLLMQHLQSLQETEIEKQEKWIEFLEAELDETHD